MRRAITLPKLGLTMTEGIVSEWLKKPGDDFRAGECLYVVENDKVANEIEAQADGVLSEITVSAGEVAPVGGVIGYWEDDGAAVSEVMGNTEPAGESDRMDVGAISDTRPDTDRLATGVGSIRCVDTARVGTETRIIASPYARKLATQHGITLADVRGTGPNGRVAARDVRAAASVSKDAAAALAPSTISASGALAASPDLPVATSVLPGQTLTAPSAAQRVVARRLVASKQEIPHFYLALDIDVTRLVQLRKEINSVQSVHRLTVNHFVVMAVARALRQMPEANRVWTEDGILSYEQIDVGIAVSTDDGLLAPALCDVGDLSMALLVQRLDSLVTRTRAGRMTQRDLGHAAITVSNAGMHHVRYMSSIINPGQAMILGVGSILPVFLPDDDERPQLHQQMGVVLSADHRVLDGVRGLQFLKCVREQLERPVQMLVL